jgi:hypothetical protein
MGTNIKKLKFNWTLRVIVIKQQTMDKYLRFDFFKRQQFPTKTDGLEFIETCPKLKKLMVKMHTDIEEYKENKIDEFETSFEKFSETKQVFLLKVKEKRLERVQAKKEIEKVALKNELRAELLRELEEEKEKELAMENEEFYPVYCKEKFNLDLDKKFAMVIKTKGKLNSKQTEELKVMKKETEKAFALLVKIDNKLEKYIFGKDEKM